MVTWRNDHIVVIMDGTYVRFSETSSIPSDVFINLLDILEKVGNIEDYKFIFCDRLLSGKDVMEIGNICLNI